ncbi:hypothetical protein HE1_00118 [Holospora elegans E1]|uniref:Uncharacterized protein n=1 Tax=Holospora elegans E1 TaxID=1427503 RepID=A0A023DWR2_9PROT|nr:hypothetical protein [Holospora elegans]GAJ45809.1 hypothetical protein HE1_00118 [Holospora elegans E1]
MKIVIDSVDKIHGNVVSGLVEKMQHTLAKLFGREEKSIVAHMFILLWLGLGRANNAPQSPFLSLLFWCLCFCYKVFDPRLGEC